jgi:hypothetical protein
MGVSGAAAWGPLSDSELVEVLRLAIEVAQEDSGHDLLTAVYVLNRDKLRATGRDQLSEAELRQVARVLVTEIPPEERVGAPGGEVAAVNAWLAQCSRRQRGQQVEGANVLAALVMRVAERLGAEDSQAEAPGGQS